MFVILSDHEAFELLDFLFAFFFVSDGRNVIKMLIKMEVAYFLFCITVVFG